MKDLSRVGVPVRQVRSKRLRVLIVDDQQFVRQALRRIIEAEADMTVVGEAADGFEAVALAKELKPDVVTMDLELPRMDGLVATARILKEVVPAPAIVMVSSYTRLGAEATLKALQAGAVDFVAKTNLSAADHFERLGADLKPKLRAWGEAVLLKRASPSARRPEPSPAGDRVPPVDLVLVAASTGGPQALSHLLKAARYIAPPVVIAQHMPRYFTPGLAKMLAEDTGMVVREGQNGSRLDPGTVTLIPGSLDGLIARGGESGLELRLTTLATNPHPSANALFESAAISAGAPLAVVLTGMGDDGTRGALRLRRRGSSVVVQTPGSCVVGGMPSAAIEAEAATHILDLDQIAAMLASAKWLEPT